MNVPTPTNDNARDDRFNRGLERLLQGDPTGIDEIDPDLQEIAIEVVKLANDAGWVGSDPGDEVIRPRPWWRNSHTIINAVAAVMVVGLVAALVTFGLRIWNSPEGQYGSGPEEVGMVEPGPGVCSRAPRTDAEVAAIVRKSESDVEPFTSDGVSYSNGIVEAVQLTRDWNACLLKDDWHRAMAYESDYFIWRLGQEEFPTGVVGFTDQEIAGRVADRHATITPLETVDGMNLAVYSADKFRYLGNAEPPLLLGVDAWLVPVDVNGDWIEWFTVVSVEWDGEQWVIVSATRDGVPESPYFRNDTLPENTPDAAIEPP